MIDWLKNLLQRTQAPEIVGKPDEPRTPPVECVVEIGDLPSPSGKLILADSSTLASVEISNIAVEKVRLSALVMQSEGVIDDIKKIYLTCGDTSGPLESREVGQLLVDCHRFFAADYSDFDRNWTQTGPERLGQISLAGNPHVTKLLVRQFGLKIRKVNPISAEVTTPISVELERDINKYLSTFPEYAQFPFMKFRVETNGSFTHAQSVRFPWGYVPIGNDPNPQMFVCEIGWGSFSVTIEACQGQTRRVTIDAEG